MTTDLIGRCNPPRGVTMFDRIAAVTAITNWPALGVKFPKALADKLAVFDAVRYVETAHAVIVDTSSVTTKNAEDTPLALDAPITSDALSRSGRVPKRSIVAGDVR